MIVQNGISDPGTLAKYYSYPLLQSLEDWNINGWINHGYLDLAPTVRNLGCYCFNVILIQ